MQSLMPTENYIRRIVRKNEGFEQLKEDHPDIEFLSIDGFDLAIIGIDHNYERLVYDYEFMISLLIIFEGMDRVDAIEHLDFNVTNAYLGDKTPIFINKIYATKKEE